MIDYKTPPNIVKEPNYCLKKKSFTIYKTPFGHKLIIPTDTTALFAVQSEDEGHFIYSNINSHSDFADFAKCPTYVLKFAL